PRAPRALHSFPTRRSSDLVAVLGTPRVVALAEAATIAALAGAVGDHETTVGSRVELDHLAPSPVGARVRAEAVLDGVAGRRLSRSEEHTSELQSLAYLVCR